MLYKEGHTQDKYVKSLINSEAFKSTHWKYGILDIFLVLPSHG